MSILTKDFEESLTHYRWEDLQVTLLLFVLYLIYSSSYIFSHCVLLVLGPISCLQHEGTRSYYP